VRASLLLIVTGVALAAQDLPPNLTELFNKGVQAEKAGRLDEAEPLCSSVKPSGSMPAMPRRAS
jgi:hypothetical protein